MDAMTAARGPWMGGFVESFTGRQIKPNELSLLEAICTHTGYPDARVWNNRVAAVVGNARGTAAQALGAFWGVSEARIYGQQVSTEVFEFLQRAAPIYEDETALRKLMSEQMATFERIGGYGRPVARDDERIAPILAAQARLGISRGRHLNAALAVGTLLANRPRPVIINYAAISAGMMADLGFSSDEQKLFRTMYFLSGVPPCQMLGTETQPGEFLALACEDIVYGGPAPVSPKVEVVPARPMTRPTPDVLLSPYGGAVVGTEVFYRQLNLHSELNEATWMDIVVYGITDQRYPPNVLRVLEHFEDFDVCHTRAVETALAVTRGGASLGQAVAAHSLVCETEGGQGAAAVFDILESLQTSAPCGQAALSDELLQPRDGRVERGAARVLEACAREGHPKGPLQTLFDSSRQGATLTFVALRLTLLRDLGFSKAQCLLLLATLQHVRVHQFLLDAQNSTDRDNRLRCDEVLYTGKVH